LAPRTSVAGSPLVQKVVSAVVIGFVLVVPAFVFA
jgi:hypothetical protein